MHSADTGSQESVPSTTPQPGSDSASSLEAATPCPRTAEQAAARLEMEGLNDLGCRQRRAGQYTAALTSHTQAHARAVQA